MVGQLAELPGEHLILLLARLADGLGCEGGQDGILVVRLVLLGGA
jgi:hypothetical protein